MNRRNARLSFAKYRVAGWPAGLSFGALVLVLVMTIASGFPIGRAQASEPLAALAFKHKAANFDIAMNGFTFSFEGATNPNGFPAQGTPFIIRGYIYPGGTFERHGATSGVLEDGSPQFPDRVLGTWYCRGWHLQDGDASVGPVVATTQVFEFKSKVTGSQQLVTDGIELAEFDVWFERTVTGATGLLNERDLRVRQIYVGFNATNSFNTSFSVTKK